MIRLLTSFGILAAMTMGSAAAQESRRPLPIKNIILYKNGMAHIVRQGRIQIPLRLSFHPQDMNDVLKSFSAWNPSTGNLYSLGYSTGIPIEQLLGRYPFDVRHPSAGLGEFLQQVKGAQVRLDLGGRNLEGRLMTIQKSQRPVREQTTATDHRVSILDSQGAVHAVWLSEVRSFSFVDVQLQDQLASYLTVLSDGTQDVTQEISIYPVPRPGPIRASYLQQFPVWKTSYRLHLGQDDSSLEGWALIDNPTGEAWEDVELTLISGMPVSFVMDLYQPLYASRTQVPVPAARAAAPRSYESGLAGTPAVPPPPPPGKPSGRSSSPRREVMPAAAPAEEKFSFEAGASQGTFQAAEAQQLQDYFEYRFPFPIRLAARQSALLPFMRHSVEAERISIYNATLDRKYPQLGAHLTNKTGVPLDAGPVTVYQEGRYGGEALIEHTALDEERLLSYGVDFETVVLVDSKSTPQTLARMTTDRGVTVVDLEHLATTTYRLSNKSKSPKTVTVEHPRTPGRRLRGDQPYESTPHVHRFRVTLEAEGSAKLTVTEVVSAQRRLRLRDSDLSSVDVIFDNIEIPPPLRRKLEAAITARRELTALERDRQRLLAEVKALTRDQQRLRENLKALGNSTSERPLRDRYVGRLAQQEDRLEQLDRRQAQLNRDISEKQRELSRLIEELDS